MWGVTTRRNHPFVRLLVACLTAITLVSACGSDDTADDASTTGSTDTTATDTTDSTDTTATTATDDDSDDSTSGSDDSGSDDSDDGSAGGPVDDSDLPGEEWDGFAAAGDEFAVMGVAHDDELNVRELPDASSTIVTSVGPTDTGLVATGRARLLPQSIWYEIDVDGDVGWVNAAFVGFMGGTDDATAEYLADGSQGGAETMVDLARAVSAAFASTEPESRIVQSVAPTVGDLGEITYDVIGLGDDSVAGFRLHIFATPDDNGETFSLKSIERTVFCSRGSDGELCT